jgi:[protein-PII] uridylyltransferase
MVEKNEERAVQGARRLEAARAELRQALRAGTGGAALSSRYSNAVADLVVQMSSTKLEEAQARFGPLGLGAIGALARRELGPHSDVDLVLVSPVTRDGEPEFDAFVRSLVHPLWDAGLRANLGVHEPQTWLAQAEDDLTLCTALLDVRPLLGHAPAFDALRDEAFARWFGDHREPFLERLRDEVAERHQRYGGTVFLVEPDLKYGPGGLRDLAVVQWCLLATHGTMDLVELAREEVIRPRMAALISSSRDTLLRLRAALQVAADRAQDRLVFQYQELLPPVLGLVGEGPIPDDALVRAVEAAMQEYYRAARDLLRYGRRLCERCRPETPASQIEPRRIDERFAIAGGKLTHDAADSFVDTPVLALEALTLARDHAVELSGSTFDAIAEAAGMASADSLAEEPEAQRRFVDLLCNADDVGTPTVLELCNELRLLERIVPEFGPIRGRMQHDSHHVYTVDQHTMGAIDMLKRIARGEYNKDYPLATALHLQLDDPRVLYLATLVHDTGKAEAGDQCETGAVIARTVATRVGLAPDEVERCALLVGEHLTMPLLSQKRDLSDPLLIEEFAETVGGGPALEELYLLSLVDTAQVRPGNLTAWKLTLLDELYLLTSAYLRRGRLLGKQRTKRIGEPAGMPDRYYSLYHLEMRRHHAGLIDRLLGDERAAVVELEQGSGALRLTLVARDRPGLLAQAVAILDDHGVDIMAADIFSSPGHPAVVVDVFRIEAKEGPEHGLDVQTVTAVEQALQRPLDRAMLETPPPPRRGARWRWAPRVPTRIGFDADPAGERTIVEIETAAGSEVLRRITLAFAAEGVEILIARAITEADRASNVFYVPHLIPEAQRSLAARLEAYLERG